MKARKIEFYCNGLVTKATDLLTGEIITISSGSFPCVIGGEESQISIVEGECNGGHGMGEMPYSELIVNGKSKIRVTAEVEMRYYDPQGYIDLMSNSSEAMK